MSTKLKEINYNGTDAHLRDALLDRNLYIPLNENNKVIRAQAIRMLQEWETNHVRFNDDKVRVIFHRSMNPSSGSYVFASINGENFQAPYEKEVEIKKYFLSECIDRARTVVERKVTEGNKTTVEVDYIPTYTYSVLGDVKKEEDVTEDAIVASE